MNFVSKISVIAVLIMLAGCRPAEIATPFSTTSLSPKIVDDRTYEFTSYVTSNGYSNIFLFTLPQGLKDCLITLTPNYAVTDVIGASMSVSMARYPLETDIKAMYRGTTNVADFWHTATVSGTNNIYDNTTVTQAVTVAGTPTIDGTVVTGRYYAMGTHYGRILYTNDSFNTCLKYFNSNVWTIMDQTETSFGLTSTVAGISGLIGTYMPSSNAYYTGTGTVARAVTLATNLIHGTAVDSTMIVPDLSKGILVKGMIGTNVPFKVKVQASVLQ